MSDQKLALISVCDKVSVLPLCEYLTKNNYVLVASGGTYKHLEDSGLKVRPLSTLTKYPELLNGRVKTLHPSVHAGILAIPTDEDLVQLMEHNVELIDVVVCNLYQFETCIQNSECTLEEAIENIDIGGVTLLRAAAKNHKRVYCLSESSQYKDFIETYKNGTEKEKLRLRKQLAIKAFKTTFEYDKIIHRYFNTEYNHFSDLKLRYGINPHQKEARIYSEHGKLPFEVINGQPGYINVLDALNSWQLVQELSNTLNVKAAASFKHVSPAGVAIEADLSPKDRKMYLIGKDTKLSPMSSAYIRARGCDRMSSFGDFIALSSKCDVLTARFISSEVSDGIIAPDYDIEALDILTKKKGGKYLVLLANPDYCPPKIEKREVFGVVLEQQRNELVVNGSEFENIVSENKELPNKAVIDMILAATTLKYTQSNSVCFTRNGTTIGIGAGQQSRIHCTRLAADKADMWFMRRLPKITQDLKFKKGVSRQHRTNIIEQYITNKCITDQKDLEDLEEIPAEILEEDILEHMQNFDNVTVCSDGFFPFSDNIKRCRESGVKYIAAPSGSIRDADCIEEANKSQMVMVHMKTRLFHH